MKTRNFLTAFALIASMAVVAQPGKGNRMQGNTEGCPSYNKMECPIPNVTDEQKTKIAALRTAHLKEVQPIKNKMGELKATQKSLSTTDNADMKAINVNIDEMTKLQNQLMKLGVQHRNEVRQLLTDEQKIWFDQHPMGKGAMKGHGMKHGFGQGQGPKGDCPMK